MSGRWVSGVYDVERRDLGGLKMVGNSDERTFGVHCLSYHREVRSGQR